MCSYYSNILDIVSFVLLYCIILYCTVYYICLQCDYFYALQIATRVNLKFYSQNVGGNLKCNKC
jgi:hypothetical protein